MKTQALVTKIANGIYAQVNAGISTLAENSKDSVQGLQDKSVDEGLAIVSTLVSAVEANIKAARVDGFALPAFLSKVSVNDNNMNVVYLTVKTKLKADYKYRKDAEITVDENLIKNIAQVYIDALFNMFYIEVARENVAELNDKLAEVIAENEIPYGVSFAVDVDTDASVLEVDNNKVVFNASISKAQDIASFSIFQQKDDEYSKLVYDKAIENLVAALKAIQTPVQLIKGNLQLVKDVTGISTKKRASKLIRESYHRKAMYLDRVKTGIGYYNEDVEINGETVEVFALVGKAEDGSLNVVLNPFNVKDLCNVDYDVIAAVKAQMA